MGAGESTNEDEERKANMTEAPPPKKNLSQNGLSQNGYGYMILLLIMILILIYGC